MSKNYKVLKGRTEIIAAIYDEQNLPSAIIDINRHTCYHPACLHSLREGDERTTDQMLEYWADEFGVGNLDELEVRLYPFHENYWEQSHRCTGCNVASSRGASVEQHTIRETDAHARKLCEDCA